MSEVAEPMFRCDVCGRRHRWSPDSAGQTITCSCGEPAPVPAEPESDLYDIAPTPVEPIKAAIVLPEIDSSPTLSYQRPLKVEIGEDYSEANPMIVSVPKDLVVPIALIVIGTMAEFVWAFRSGPPADAAGLVGRDFVTQLLTMLAGVIVAAQILSVNFGPIPTAILKLAAIAVGPTGLTALLVWALGGGVPAVLFGWVLHLAVYVGLFWYFFELDLEDLGNTIVILYGVHMVASFVLHVLWH